MSLNSHGKQENGIETRGRERTMHMKNIARAELPNALNVGYVEKVLSDYERDPNTVSPQWREYFEALSREIPDEVESSWPTEENYRGDGHEQASDAGNDIEALQDRVDQLVRAYRVRGHMIARLDPLGSERPFPPELDPARYGFTEADMDHSFSSHTLGGRDRRTLREIVTCLRNTYCRSIGVQFMHIDELDVRHWLQDHMEETENRLELTRDQQVRIFTRLTDAVIFEQFIQKKYVGAKRFSLEGSESLIPLLELAIEKAGEYGVNEIVMGMAHRGRLNVLANILGKSPAQIFREFEDIDDPSTQGRGDVKYHLGYSSDWTTAADKKVHLTLCFNPSHLEFVNPVAMGRTRAKQDRYADEGDSGMLMLIHGDAAFVGEGVVQETLNMSGLPGYRIGGTLHVIVNNQIGFTTTPAEGRSCVYATDPAKMLQAPIFHVNGEDPEAVAQVILLAMEFRRKWRRDVFVDMYCYRCHGHNETDEPSYTQPVISRAIEQRKSVRDSYLEHLLALNGLTKEDADAIAQERVRLLEEGLDVARSDEFSRKPQTMQGLWSGYKGGPDAETPEIETGFNLKQLSSLLESQTNLPEDFHLHPRLPRFLDRRREMAQGKHPLDWSAGEALAFATLLLEGIRVRLSGQDSARGTFSQRHATLHDYETAAPYVPLQHLSVDQAQFEAINSPLNETGVLGFDYGYSLDYPDGLILWEAQFGDFCNVAQVIIDQFIATAEVKWQRLSGLVLLLPHGFEGQGPEHSSARLERFLTLAAQDNFQVVNPTTPAQYFHVLRRQVLRKWRKPLVIMTPKSLLRHPAAVSPLEDLSKGQFQRIIPDSAIEPGKASRVLLCSGKIYYDLLARRQELKRKDVAIVRVEQLYPLAPEAIKSALSIYTKKTSVVWIQEEPENMGACRYMRLKMTPDILGGKPFTFISRPECASPATGSAKMHKAEQESLLQQAFAKE